MACDVKYLTWVNSNSSSNEQMVKLKVIYYWPLQKKATILDVILRMWTHQINNIIISYFYNKKTSAIYVACVSGVERGGGGGRGKGMRVWKGKKRDTCYKNPPPPPHLKKRKHFKNPRFEKFKKTPLMRKNPTI